jgi:hypothetical protein
VSPTTLAELPYLDEADPAFSIRSPDVKAARAQSWFARTPYGIAVLRYDEVQKMLRHPYCGKGATCDHSTTA